MTARPRPRPLDLFMAVALVALAGVLAWSLAGVPFLQAAAGLSLMMLGLAVVGDRRDGSRAAAVGLLVLGALLVVAEPFSNALTVGLVALAALALATAGALKPFGHW